MTPLLLLLACDPGRSRPLPDATPTDSPSESLVESTAPDDSAPDTSPTDTSPTDTSPPADTCGEGTCDADEDCWNCATDCGECDCPLEAEVVFYTSSGWNILSDALLADPSPCADYYISIPAVAGDKLHPRGDGEPEAMRARGPRFHAVAEFHWQTWKDEPGTWYDKGVSFRERMVERGYDVDAGDTWAVNEVPSDGRDDSATQQAALDLFQGLYEGPSGATPVKGVAFIINMGHNTQNFAVYKPIIQDWLEKKDFWTSANKHVGWWAQEVYTDPHQVCAPDTTTAERSAVTNDFVQHVARHAEVGPDSANTAQSYLGRAYTPLMNAVWLSSAGYGDTQISHEDMKHFVSSQVYAARAWASDHGYPDGRIGFGWDRPSDATEAELTELAERLASAIHRAYDEGGGAARYACSPSGAYTWCQCKIDGVELDQGWATFDDW